MIKLICYVLKHDWHTEKSEGSDQINIYRICLRCGMTQVGEERTGPTTSNEPKELKTSRKKKSKG